MAEKSTVTLTGTVEKIIESARPTEPEKAQIAVAGAGILYRELRIDNSLTDEKGNEVRLKGRDDPPSVVRQTDRHV